MPEGAPVFVTGGTGFVGRHVVDALVTCGHPVVLLTRTLPAQPRHGVTSVSGALEDVRSYAAALEGCRAVIHLAARAHVLRDRTADPLRAFRQINTDATQHLAAAARAAGVGSFVFVSSIGVNGDYTEEHACFGPDSPPAPVQFYAISKHEAELVLTDLAGPDFKVTVVRPPLVYGPGAPGNFRRLLLLVRSGVPLPLGGLNNCRSLIGVQSLTELLVRSLAPGEARVRTLLAADAAPVSSSEIIEALAEGLQVPARLFELPSPILAGARSLPWTRRMVRQLFESLCVDPSATAAAVGWAPVSDSRAGLVAMAASYRFARW